MQLRMWLSRPTARLISLPTTSSSMSVEAKELNHKTPPVSCFQSTHWQQLLCVSQEWLQLRRHSQVLRTLWSQDWSSMTDKIRHQPSRQWVGLAGTTDTGATRHTSWTGLCPSLRHATWSHGGLSWWLESLLFPHFGRNYPVCHGFPSSKGSQLRVAQPTKDYYLSDTNPSTGLSVVALLVVLTWGGRNLSGDPGLLDGDRLGPQMVSLHGVVRCVYTIVCFYLLSPEGLRSSMSLCLKYLQGIPIKNNPLGKINNFSYCNRFFYQIYTYYRWRFRPHRQQILLQYLLWFKNYH